MKAFGMKTNSMGTASTRMLQGPEKWVCESTGS